jgi:hypothetical protein
MRRDYRAKNDAFTMNAFAAMQTESPHGGSAQAIVGAFDDQTSGTGLLFVLSACVVGQAGSLFVKAASMRPGSAAFEASADE